ncbi:DUF4352 domain-containing protein [Clostridium rectalis]|uniref:DUF4352 domain-containing protein n=1 Tax=Clostridium rectalis TaxID=2040295 RepID=UPI001FAB28AE|nr:DUF4352 domain-containing protein [Clostridium rectalis]
MLLTLIMVSSLTACGGKDKAEKADSKATATEEKKDEPKVFKVGDAIKLKDFKVTVNKVYTVKPSDILKPEEGNEFFAVDCTIENTSKEKQSISSMLMFKVVDKDGRDCKYSLTGQSAADAGQLDGELAVGRKMTGVYVVEVPKGQKDLELVFDASLLGGEQTIVKLR